MEILITDVAERVRPLCAAQPPAERQIRLVAPRLVQVSTSGVRLQGLGRPAGLPQADWSAVSGFGMELGMGFYAADTKRDHGAMTHNSITFSTRQGPSCSPPV